MSDDIQMTGPVHFGKTPDGEVAFGTIAGIQYWGQGSTRLDAVKDMFAQAFPDKTTQLSAQFAAHWALAQMEDRS